MDLLDTNQKKAIAYTALFVFGIIILSVLFINFPLFVAGAAFLGMVGGMIFLIYLAILEYLDDKL